ncbi:MAG: MFS transporter [Oscillospiraceae bacterium]|nr:MFS transporter [Oscillospiraceae bacterium]
MSKLTEKITKTPRGWDTKPRERLSYYLYFCGQNAIYNLVSSFLTTYLMFSFASEAETGVDPLTLTAGIMLVVKIWDAVNDAIFGVIFDKVRFKSGNKFVPWLKISLVFIPLTTVLLFAIPNSLGTNAKLAWLAISYILWDTAYTLCDVPIFGVITAMSENLDERNSILSYKSIWSGIGSGVALILGTVLVGEYVHLNYTVVAVVCAVFALITMIPACFRLEERYVGDRDEEFTLRKMFSYLAKNKYLLIYYIGYFFYSSANVSVALNLFVSFYLFNNSQFSLIVSAISLVPSAIFAFLVPHFIRRMDKMKLFRICTLAAIALSVVMWAVGYSSIVWFIVLSVLRSIPVSILGVMLFLFTPDCAEYGKFKSGIEAKGITFSIQTFMVKLTAAISAAIPMFILGLSGWVSVNVNNFDELARSGVTQTPHALSVLWFLYVLLPAIGYLIAYFIWRFYDLNDHDVQVMTDCNAGKITREEAESLLSKKY